MTHPDTPEVGGDGNPADANPATAFEEIAAEMLGEEEQPEAEVAETEAEDEPSEEDIEQEPDLPAIDPPNSLTAEEKEAFKSLPREAQEFTARRIGELEKGFQTKAQEAAQAKEAARTEALQFAAQLKDEAVQHLTQYAKQFEVQPPDPRLITQNPEAYAQQLATYQYAQAQREQAQRDAEKAAAERDEYKAALQQHEAQQFHQRLKAELPEAYDASGQLNQGFIDTLAATAEALGYDANAINNSTIEELKALKVVSELKADADKYRTLMKKKMERVRAGKNPPPVTKPGAPRGNAQVKKQRADEAFARAKALRPGSDRDAAMAEYLINTGVL